MGKQKKRDLVLSCYTVDIASDSDDIHLPTICNGCYARMSRLSASRGKNHYTPAEGIVAAWSLHTDSCFLCHAKSGVGRPAKSTKNRGGRPPGETTNTIIAHIRVSAAPSVHGYECGHCQNMFIPGEPITPDLCHVLMYC